MDSYDDLIARMTIEQKCALLSGAGEFTTRAYPELGIPELRFSDGPNGLRKQAGASDHLGLNPSEPATCFPTACTMANSWDPVLAQREGAAMGEEAAAQGVNVLLGPGLNIKRNPLCGRNFEYYSEDPLLAGRMAAACVRGIQSRGVAACPKHFAVNSQETRRMASDSVVDERTMRELYLSGFERVVRESAPKCLMSSYNLVNGTYANESRRLLGEILRREWGYRGAVVTDWGGSNDHAAGVAAGSTFEMPNPGKDSVRELVAAVRSGSVGGEALDARVREALALIFSTDAAVRASRGWFDAEAHHALAREIAAQCAVLLKNEGALLPLALGTRVALIGDFADAPRYQGAGSSAVNATQVDSLRVLIGESGLDCVGYEPGYRRDGGDGAALVDKAVVLAKRADVALVCLGLTEIQESEGLDARICASTRTRCRCSARSRQRIPAWSCCSVRVPRWRCRGWGTLGLCSTWRWAVRPARARRSTCLRARSAPRASSPRPGRFATRMCPARPHIPARPARRSIARVLTWAIATSTRPMCRWHFPLAMA